MRRREFIGLIGAAAFNYPRQGFAQARTDLPVVGLLLPTQDNAQGKSRIAALRKGLQEAGFVEPNYSLAVRFAEGDYNRAPQLAAELAALNHASSW